MPGVDRSSLIELIERLRPALDRMPIGCVCNDERFHFVYWNRAAERIFNYSYSEVSGAHPFETITPKESQHYVEALFERLARGDMGANGVGLNRTKEGREILCDWINTPLIAGDGRFVGIMSMCQDITERVRAEDALRQSEQRFRALFENANVGIVILAADGRIQSVNRCWQEMSGYGADRIGASLEELVLDGDVPALREALALASSGQHWSGVLRFDRMGGGIVWTEATASIVSEDHESSSRVALMLKDLSAEREIQERLRRDEIKYQTLVETTRDVIWSVDAEGRITFVNRIPSLRVFGYRPEEMIGRFFSEFSPPDRINADRDAFISVRNAEIVSDYETEIVRKDGSIVRLSINAVPLLGEDGAVVGTTGTASDITARKRTEAELERKRRFVELLHHAAIAANEATSLPEAFAVVLERVRVELGFDVTHSFLVSEDGVSFTSSGVWRDAGTAELAEFREKSEQAFLQSRDASTLPGRAIENKAGIWFRDFPGAKLLRSDLAAHCGLRTAVCIPVVAANEVVATIELFSREPKDEDRDTLELLEQIGTQLGRAIERQRAAARLQRSEEQLRQSQKMEAMGRLAGGVAHDFNNLLTAINGYSELILKSLSSDSPIRPAVREVKRAGERAARLTEQLLAFSRKQVLRSEVIDLQSLVREMDRMLRRVIGEDVELVTRLDPRTGRVRANTGQIEQVVMNLVVNARDAMPSGGTIVIETGNVEVRTKMSAGPIGVMPGSYVCLSVRDTGTGMSKEVLQHLWEPFFTTKEKGKGTGLGLPMVYGIVKQNSGHIWVETELGKGTTFQIFFPIIETDEDAKTFVPAITSVRGAERILVVEDDDAVRRLVRDILEMEGYEVTTASDAQEATSIAEKDPRPIDLLLTDVVMRNMSGRVLAESLAVKRPEMRVLYMSGYADDAILHHGVRSSELHFISKPFTPDALLSKLREVLDAEPQ